MDIKPRERSIREILSAQKQYVIPRFQREYSWDKRNYNEFLLDMLNNLEFKEGKISATPYFMGTMLFVGNAEDETQRQSQVVDGQQRLTTITILFSALSNVFSGLGEGKLADNVFRYIMSEDDNGQEVRILKTVSSYPYFSFYIQSQNKDDAEGPTTEEEKVIKETYDFFFNQLQEKSIRSLLKQHWLELPYLDILKALRDQILDSTIIEIYTNDNTIANKLFEILNAKGKQLSFIDLIKNKIFTHVKEIEPADFATETWADVTDILNTGEEKTGFATFFRHYWSSKYKKSTQATLYHDFEKLVKIDDYRNLMRDLKHEAETYQKISNPSRTAFQDKKQYYPLVQSLKAFNNFFNVVQVRVPLLALIDAKDRSLIQLSKLIDIVNYLENFHFAYNSILAKSPNRVDTIYSSFSISLRRCQNAGDVHAIIKDKLISPLERIFPTYEEFSKGFSKLRYTKKDSQLNLKTKYALNKLNCLYQETILFDDDGSVEHIIPEGDGDTINIGNLILLERDLNNEAGNLPYEDKKVIYSKSRYKWVNDFISTYGSWSDSNILERAKALSWIYYKDIFKKNLSEKTANNE